MQPKRVLVIDDDVPLAKALLTRLGAAGYSAAHAACGEAGIADASSQPPAAIVLDIRMPGIDGLEVARRLRADTRTATVPILFLSAETASHDRTAEMARIGNAHLRKPYDARELLRIVASLTN